MQPNIRQISSNNSISCSTSLFSGICSVLKTLPCMYWSLVKITTFACYLIPLKMLISPTFLLPTISPLLRTIAQKYYLKWSTCMLSVLPLSIFGSSSRSSSTFELELDSWDILCLFFLEIIVVAKTMILFFAFDMLRINYVMYRDI